MIRWLKAHWYQRRVENLQREQLLALEELERLIKEQVANGVRIRRFGGAARGFR